MLDIRIDGESVDLLPSTSLTLERFNPLFSFDSVQGSRVYGFELPATPTNRRLLGYFYQDQVGYQARKFRCEKYFAGQLIEQGYVMIHDVKPSGYSVFFTQNLGEIFGDSQNVTLSQLNLGVEAIGSSADANHLVDPYAFPTIRNEAFYGNQALTGFNGLMNEWTGGTPNAVARVPMPFLGQVLGQFGALTGWQFKGQYTLDADLQRLLLYNTYSLDGLTTINANNHLPGLTMPQLLIDLRKLFNLYLEFDVYKRVCTMDFGAQVLTGGDVVDWTDKAQPQHIKAPDLTNRLELSYELDSNDALLKPIPAPLETYTSAETTVTEDGALLPIRSRVSTLLTDAGTGRAMTAQVGSSPLNKENKNPSTPKLLFWHGLVNGEPTATAVHGNRSLYWHGPNNLVDRSYRQLEQFKADTFTVTKVVYLTPADLARFSFRQKVHISGVNYLVGSMKAQLSSGRQLIPAEVSLLRA
ncbi:hypothetical protein ACAW74_04910 [Fibrella sp. WM1]|uniref:hypothetical protein n=1 Tax=Fibrella musci TaxID=3242485 RepID=UPI003522B892